VHGKRLRDSADALRPVPTWAIGGCSGVAFYLITLPIDRAKTIMMTQPLPGGAASAVAAPLLVPVAGASVAAATAPPPRFESAAAALREVAERDGWRGLYRGCAPTLLRTFVGQAVALTAYDWASARLAFPQEA